MFLVGIEPRAPGLHVFEKFHIPRLGLPQLMTIAELRGHECVIYCEDISPIDWLVVDKADMILISSITSTINRAFDIIRQIRRGRNKKVPILIGGPHVTFLPDEALSNGADYVFQYEADETLPGFLDWYSQSDRDPRDLLKSCGISFLVGGQRFHTPRPPFVNLDTLPTPNLRLISGYQPTVIPHITSRGCPYKCSFCMEHKFFGNRYRFRSTRLVLVDHRYYDGIYNRKIDVFYAEDNHAASLNRIHELCRGVIDNGLVRPFFSQVRLDLAMHPDTLRLMSTAGYNRQYIGYESRRQAVLDDQEKHLDAAKMAEYTHVFHESGQAIHSMWIFGFDGDTPQTVKETVKFCIKNGIETTQFAVLVPMPGSDAYDVLLASDRIFSFKWPDFDGHHVVFRPQGMSARQLQYMVMLKAMPNLYSLWQTAQISMSDAWNTAVRTFGRIFGQRQWHPVFEFKKNLGTLLARLWAWWATRKVRKPIQQYLKKLPAD